MDELKIDDSFSSGSVGRLKSNSLYNIGQSRLIAVHGDIVHFEADAIVCETSEELVTNVSDKEDFVSIGMSVNISKACGPKYREACLEIKEVSPDCRCPTGEARITKAFDLQTAKFIIHTVGPIYAKYDKPTAKKLLKSCYLNCFDLAPEYKLARIALPLISVGLSGYPLKDAIQVALDCTAAVAKIEYPKEVYFIMQSKNEYKTFEDLATERFTPEKVKSAKKKNPFLTKGSTFRMNQSQKVMLGLKDKHLRSFREFLVEEDNADILEEDAEEKNE